jgi:hypothetical protein
MPTPWLVPEEGRSVPANPMNITVPDLLAMPVNGYVVYRDFVNRLRCWAHLARKTKGLAESSHQRVAQVGRQLQQHVDELMRAVYAARQAKAKQQPPASHDEQVAAFKQLCQQLPPAARAAGRSARTGTVP